MSTRTAAFWSLTTIAPFTKITARSSSRPPRTGMRWMRPRIASSARKPRRVASRAYEIVSAYQGREGVALAQEALVSGQPFAMAFVDMRMPPGWDGLETIEKLWAQQPDLQVVLCTAHSDYSLEEIPRAARRVRPTAHSKKTVRHGGAAAVCQRIDGEVASRETLRERDRQP